MRENFKLLIFIFAAGVNSSLLAQIFDNPFSFYSNKNYQQAQEKFSELSQKNPNDFRWSYNEGVSAYRSGRFEDAAKAFRKSRESLNSELSFNSNFNLGNTYTHLRDFDQAIESYQQALELRPNDAKTLENLAYVEQLKKQKEQEDKDKKDNNKNDKNDKKDKNDKSEKSENKEEKQAENHDSEQQNAEQKNLEEKNAQEQQQNAMQEDQSDSEATESEKSALQEGDQLGEMQEFDSQKFEEQQAQKLIRGVEDRMDLFRFVPSKEQRERAKQLERDW